jgi:ammonium transporter Rh
MGTCANMTITPGIALAIGVFTGLISTLGFSKIQGFLERKIALYDTCGIFYLHGIPGMLGGAAGAIAPLLVTVMPSSHQKAIIAYWFNNGAEFSDSFVWSYSTVGSKQALSQALCLVITLVLAIVTGSLTGFLVKALKWQKTSYLDVQYWHLPENEESEPKNSSPVTNPAGKGDYEHLLSRVRNIEDQLNQKKRVVIEDKFEENLNRAPKSDTRDAEPKSPKPKGKK